MNLKSLSDEALLLQTGQLVENERKITADVIKHFFEVNRRKLYLARGFDSLFSMLTKEYRYCPATAMLRINAVRLMNDVPDVIEKIESGEMPVTVVANIQSFLNSEAKTQRAYSKEAKIELVETCLGKSVLEVQKEFVRRNPEIERKESVRLITEDRLRVSHSISNALEEKLQRIKMLWSHVDPNMSREDLLDRMAEITLDRIDPVRKIERAKKRAENDDRASTNESELAQPPAFATSARLSALAGSALLGDSEIQLRVPEIESPIDVSAEAKSHSRDTSSSRSRVITSDEDRKVWARNAFGGCEFVNESTGQRCGSHFQLQRDHIDPWSHGGSNEAENLRLLCANHNRWRWTSRSETRIRSRHAVYR